MPKDTHNLAKPSFIPIPRRPAFGDCARYLRDQACEHLSSLEKRFVLECCSLGFNRLPTADQQERLLRLFCRKWKRTG